MSLSKKIKNIATTASLIGTLAVTSVFGINNARSQQSQEPQPVPSQTQETKRISKRYPLKITRETQNEKNYIVYTYIDTISAQEYNEIVENEKEFMDKISGLVEKIVGIDIPFDISAIHEEFRLQLTEEDTVDQYLAISETEINGEIDSSSRGELFSSMLFVKSNKPEIQNLEAKIVEVKEFEARGINLLIQATDKTDYEEQRRMFFQKYLPPEDLTVLLGETEQSDLSYQYTITDENGKTTIIETTQNQYTTRNPVDSKNLTIEAVVRDEIGNETEREVKCYGEQIKVEEETTTKGLGTYKILFVRTAVLEDRTTTEFKLYCINKDGSDLREIIDKVGNFCLSPDKTKIAFSTHNEEIGVVNVDGKGLTKLIQTQTERRRVLEWLNNDEILFFSEREWKKGDYTYPVKIGIINKDGSGLKEIPKNDYFFFDYRREGQYTISRDRTKIGIILNINGDGEIFLIDTNRNNLVTRLINTPTLWEESISFFPDGKRILFEPRKEYKKTPAEIYTIDLETKITQNLTNTPNIDECLPKLSPDGSQVAFISNSRDKPLPEVYIMNSDGSNRKDLMNTPPLCGEVFEGWSPDGSKIVLERIFYKGDTYKEFYDGIFTGCYTRGDEYVENEEIYIINKDGSNLIKIPGFSYWSPDGNEIAFYKETYANKVNGLYRGRFLNIHIMYKNGTNIKKITSNPNEWSQVQDWGLTWLPSN